VENRAKGAARLFEHKAAHADGGVLPVPILGHVLKSKLELPALARGKRGARLGCGTERPLDFAQDNLTELVAEFRNELDVADYSRAVIRQFDARLIRRSLI
jgi:hypothetical protein